MITLITGTPGSGKTLYAVTRLIKEINQNPDRPVYSDIKGLKIEGVHPVPDDWRETPEGSLLIYDECQYREMFTRARGKTKFQAILDLTTHRHTGRDIWLITQSPHFLHVDVLAVVGEHIHVDRPMGAKLANIYKWRQAEQKPQGRTVKEKAESRSLFKYDKDVFNYYASVDVDDDKANHKGLKIPKILIITIGGGSLLLLYVLFGLYNDYKARTNKEQPAKVEKKSQYDQMKEEQASQNQDNPFMTSTPNQDTTIVQDEPTRIYHTKTNEQILNEKRAKYLNEFHVEFNHDDIRPAQVISNATTCMAFNKYGDKLNISRVQCLDLALGQMPKARNFDNMATMSNADTSEEPTESTSLADSLSTQNITNAITEDGGDLDK